MCCMWLNVNFNINPPTQWSCCYPEFIRLIIRKWKCCYPSPACWGTQLHVSAWSQPYPSSFMTTAKPWHQKNHHSSTQIWDVAVTKTNCDTLLSAAVPLPLQVPSLSCRCGGCNPAAPQRLLASVPETLPSSPSPTLMWCRSKLQHCSELVLSSLCSQPVPRDTFLRLPEVSQKEKPSWAPPMPPKLFYRQRSDHNFFFYLFPSFTLSLVAWLGGGNPTPFI